MQFTLRIARATQARATGALPFAIPKGFRPPAPQILEAKAKAVDVYGHPVPGVAATDLTVTVGADGSLDAQWKSGPPAHAHPVGYRTETAVAWAQENLTATGPQVTRNAQPELAIPGRCGPGTAYPQLTGRPAIGPTDTRGYVVLGRNTAPPAAPTWFLLQLGARLAGWVEANRVQAAANAVNMTVAAGPTCVSAGPHARVRPQTTAAEIARLARGGGTRMALTGLRRASPTWWQVQLDETRRGWVHADQLETVGDLAALRAALPYLGLKPTTRRDVTVRAGPGSAYPPVACIERAGRGAGGQSACQSLVR